MIVAHKLSRFFSRSSFTVLCLLAIQIFIIGTRFTISYKGEKIIDLIFIMKWLQVQVGDAITVSYSNYRLNFLYKLLKIELIFSTQIL